jgi:YegS/Rv2252/BmrU family lipid kinase
VTQRSFRILVNPAAGRGAAPHRALPVAKLLRAAGAEVEIVQTRSVRDAGEETARTADSGAVAVAAGGDGMVALVAGAAVTSGARFGMIPAGRGNDFARQLGIDPEAGAQAIADHLLDGTERKVDVIDTHDRIVVGSVYAGVDSRASEILDRSRWVPSALLYRYAAVRALATYKPVEYVLEIDGERHEKRAATVVIANSGYYGSGMHIAPDAEIDDGLLDIVVIDAASRVALLRSMPKVYDGSHVALDEVTVLRGRTVTLSSADPVEAYGDGDRLTALPVTATVRPGSLTVIA